MKKVIYCLLLPVIGAVAVSCSSINLNAAKLQSAGAAALSAMTISDQQVMQLSAEAVAQLDAESKIAPANSPYTQRLARLTSGMQTLGSLPLNYKVYLTDQVNAFATGDGSIRVYSGLMDVMDDNELVAVLGHEIGHVANSDVRDAMRNQYLALAAREALGSTGNVAATLTDSQLGALATAYVDAQYSQKQEFEADRYGFEVSTSFGYSPSSMAGALQKLMDISGGGQGATSGLVKAFSTHPDSAERVARMRQAAANYNKKYGGSLVVASGR